MGKKARLESCFITAPMGVDTQPLQQLLTDHGIQVQDVLSLPSGPGSIVGVIESAIRHADFVCAVIVPPLSSNVLFETGLAYGARKPLFLIVDKQAELPDFLKDFFYVRASPQDTDAIAFNLDPFLTRPTSSLPVRYQGAAEDPSLMRHLPDSRLKDVVHAQVESLRRLEEGERAKAFEKLVADLLKETSAVVSHESYQDVSDEGVDMALWLDDIESSLGNPVLVELQIGQLSESRLAQAEQQLQHNLRQTNARVGLLIYRDQTGRRFPSSHVAWPLVVRFDVEDLADIISKGELVPTLLRARNKVAHGRA